MNDSPSPPPVEALLPPSPPQPPAELSSPPSEPPLRIAILLNSHRSPFLTSIRASYERAIAAVSPDAILSFFYPAESPERVTLLHGEGDLPPDPSVYDLIVVGGGNTDPRAGHAWIQRVHRFVLDCMSVSTRSGSGARPKVCGICWGHQTIALLFGGEVVEAERPELGVTEAKLTPTGRRFFASRSREGTLRLQQHHRRAVGKPPQGFSELVAGNQGFLSHDNTILTLQGHPEKDAQCARLRIHDATRWYGLREDDEAARSAILRSMEQPHHGKEVWERILRWAREKQPSHEVHL
ncbi:hypothetical protein VTJ49DRAFT_1126 [Mycothermus thermophilus]|uniref:Glutamine amidotransferase domain-containing protein n=1 Tax=Humicola insolens TaxID=85995 RepID=A0ABR3VNP7_HUMIN